MEGNTFRFRISLGYVGDIDLWIEIPIELHQRISDSVGKSKMERFEFGFKFADIIKEKFPELDTMIHQKIESWKEEYRDVDIPHNVLHLYGLTSSWFEE